MLVKLKSHTGCDNVVTIHEGECYVGQPFCGYGLRQEKSSPSTVLGVLIQKAKAEVSAEEQAKRKVSTRRGLISIIGIFGFITLVTKLGFFLTSVAYLLFEFFLLDTKRSLRKTILFIVLAIAFSGIVYYVFRYQVYVRLPKGILG